MKSSNGGWIAIAVIFAGASVIEYFPLFVSTVGVFAAYACYWRFKSAAKIARINQRWNREGIAIAILVTAVCLPY